MIMSLEFVLVKLSPWRNRLARSAVNRKVGGSSPPGDDIYYYFIFHRGNSVCRFQVKNDGLHSIVFYY